MSVLEGDKASLKRDYSSHYTDLVKASCSYMATPRRGVLGYWQTLPDQDISLDLFNQKGIHVLSFNEEQQYEPSRQQSYKLPLLMRRALTSGVVRQVKVPSAIEEAIQEAQHITGLTNNWDEDGAQQISKETLDTAATFLKSYADYLSLTYNVEIDAPEINPVKNGSIDLEWHTQGAQMLINIRRKEGQYYAFYYGDRYNDKMPIKGNVPMSEFSESLAVWMKYLL